MCVCGQRDADAEAAVERYVLRGRDLLTYVDAGGFRPSSALLPLQPHPSLLPSPNVSIC